jgi:hypothetical protein
LKQCSALAETYRIRSACKSRSREEIICDPIQTKPKVSGYAKSARCERKRTPKGRKLAKESNVLGLLLRERVDALSDAYEVMVTWLKPGGYALHLVDFSSHHVTEWNGHWALDELMWFILRDGRPYSPNRHSEVGFIRWRRDVTWRQFAKIRV